MDNSFLIVRQEPSFGPWKGPATEALQQSGSLSLFQGIFPTQGSNTGLPHCWWILYQQSHKGSPSSTTEASHMAARPQRLQTPGLGSLRPHPSAENWIKDLLSMGPPTRARPKLSPDDEFTSALVLDFPAFRTVKNKVVLFLSYLVSVILLQQPRGTKILSSSILHWLETEHSPFDFFLNSSLVHNLLSFLPDFSSCSSIIKPSPFFCLLISFFRICMKFIL